MAKTDLFYLYRTIRQLADQIHNRYGHVFHTMTGHLLRRLQKQTKDHILSLNLPIEIEAAVQNDVISLICGEGITNGLGMHHHVTGKAQICEVQQQTLIEAKIQIV
ncbi:hypothetical protein D3C76_1538010 [compost metagenome]